MYRMKVYFRFLVPEGCVHHDVVTLLQAPGMSAETPEISHFELQTRNHESDTEMA